MAKKKEGFIASEPFTEQDEDGFWGGFRMGAFDDIETAKKCSEIMHDIIVKHLAKHGLHGFEVTDKEGKSH